MTVGAHWPLPGIWKVMHPFAPTGLSKVVGWCHINAYPLVPAGQRENAKMTSSSTSVSKESISFTLSLQQML